MRLLLIMGWLVSAAVARPAEAPAAVLERWLEKASSLQSLEAELSQERSLRTLRRPLVSPGRLWFKAPDSLRWQMGDPPRMIVVKASSHPELWVLEPPRQRARAVYPGSLGRSAPALEFLRAGFPRSAAEFHRTFAVLGQQLSDGVLTVTARPKGPAAAEGVQQVVFRIDAASHHLREFEVELRDGSRLLTRVTSLRENPPLTESLFEVSLQGYKVEEEK